jgi:ribulose-phosphate 3-epimerase
MAVIAPTVTAYDLHEYRRQINVLTPFAKRIHIDLMDGVFAPTKSPDVDKIWLPDGIKTDIHMMFKHPHRHYETIMKLNPYTWIVPAEAVGVSLASLKCWLGSEQGKKPRLGIALLPESDPMDDRYYEHVSDADYVLIFSGHLGYHGGVADLDLLKKVAKVQKINPEAEIAWDGGINPDNIKLLVDAGVSVLNVGGSIQKQKDPEQAYSKLLRILAK